MRIHKAGAPFVLGALAISAFFGWAAMRWESTLLGCVTGVFVLLTLFCAYFFRDPERQIPSGTGVVLSPADGKVMEVVKALDASAPGESWVIRIFLSVFDPHIQRAPMAGTVSAIHYTKGKFLDARDPKAAFENEQNRMELKVGGSSTPVVITQIAGLIARRIVCWVREGQEVAAGERLGLIRFGSQVDVVLPLTATIRVKAGDRVTAGDCVLADLH